jgi:DNA-binding NtrC family response regulator
MSENDEILEKDIAFDELSLDDALTTLPNPFDQDTRREDFFPFTNVQKLPDLKSDSELSEILTALKMNSTRDNAARELGISPRTLRQKLNDFRKAGLPVPGPYART